MTKIVGIVVRIDVLFLNAVLHEGRLVCWLAHKPEVRVPNLVMGGLEEIDSLWRESVRAHADLWSHVCLRL